MITFSITHLSLSLLSYCWQKRREFDFDSFSALGCRVGRRRGKRIKGITRSKKEENYENANAEVLFKMRIKRITRSKKEENYENANEVLFQIIVSQTEMSAFP